MARLGGDDRVIRRPRSTAESVLTTLDDLDQQKGERESPATVQTPTAPKPKGPPSSSRRRRSAPSKQISNPPKREAFEDDLVQVAVMFRPSVLAALERTVRELRAGGERTALASVMRLGLEGLPADVEATLAVARAERAAGDAGRGVERNVRVYAHQRAVLERATATLTERRVLGAQSLLVNAVIRRLVDAEAGEVGRRLAEFEARREDAALTTAAA